MEGWLGRVLEFWCYTWGWSLFFFCFQSIFVRFLLCLSEWMTLLSFLFHSIFERVLLSVLQPLGMLSVLYRIYPGLWILKITWRELAVTAEHSGLSKPKIAEAPKSAKREKREKGRDRGTGQMRWRWLCTKGTWLPSHQAVAFSRQYKRYS